MLTIHPFLATSETKVLNLPTKKKIEEGANLMNILLTSSKILESKELKDYYYLDQTNNNS
jgi:hypothetical protein